MLRIKRNEICISVIGTSSGIPLVFNIHFRGTMDHWDPDFINPLAATRPILLWGNCSFKEWAQNIVGVIEALGIKQVDVLGFSMGGCVAQLIAINNPNLVRKLVLAGTVPSEGLGVVKGAPEPVGMLATAATEEENHQGFLKTFYTLSDKKQAIGEKWWKRMTSARKDRSDYLGPEGTQNQIAAMLKWLGGEFREDGSYDRLAELTLPVFNANGCNDVLAPTENSYVMYKKMVNAEAHLHVFPDSGHGFLNEYASTYSTMVIDFLDGKW
ncbi:Alpha/Beta hydrolase protein [Lipomyces doorenjongii]|uniref:Alpha/Beta hydrolase protein n=1 Tax=Lipomyces doorenjongii TaxID=383834 RepID=UPI0034D00826